MADLIFTDNNDESRVGALTQSMFRFRVHFRRPESYMGEYGFDWLQDEFLTCTTLDKLKKEYNPCTILNQEYLTAWMSIKNGQSFKVNLSIEIFEGTPSEQDVIKLNPQKGISFEPSIIKITDIINNTIKHFPTGEDKGTEIIIKCAQYISKDTVVEVYDKNSETIGKLSFLKNDIEYKLPIRVVLLVRKGFEINDKLLIENHLIHNADSDFNGLANLSECMQSLEEEMNKYSFNQAFVKCEFEKKIHKVAIDENEWIREGYINSDGILIDRSDLNSDLLNLYKIQIEKGSSGTDFFKGVIIIISNFEGENMAGKGNLNIIDDRNCIVFKIDTTTERTRTDGTKYRLLPDGNIHKSVYIHEVGHVLSLTHPFQVFNKDDIQENEEFVVSINDYLGNPHVSQAEKDAVWSAIAIA